MRKLYLPMLAESADRPFSSEEWIYEIKWDGIRAISYIGKGSLSIRSRNGTELSQNFPELGELTNLTSDAVLDGEIVVMSGGRADFQATVSRMKASGRMEIQRLAATQPSTYIVFDALEVEGVDLTGRPLMERKETLQGALKEGEHVVISTWGEEVEYIEAAFAKGVEGVMAKKKDSVYEAGRRSGNWLKVKKISSCDCVVIGYTTGKGARGGLFGALLLGLYGGGRLTFVGKVGTGFTEGMLKEIMKILKPLRAGGPPSPSAEEEGAQWVEPSLVVDVAYQAVTKEGKLRIPRFRGLRLDKRAEECTLDQIRPKLREYKGKRDFSTTPEPAGDLPSEGGGLYVVQEHHARRLHYDLRLEREGVLKSWAIPKGMPEGAGEKRLAIEVEDHPVEYGGFEGTIPKGEYGAGTVSIWDRGRYRALAWGGDTIEVEIMGARLKGRYILTRFKKAGEKQWLIFRAGEKGV
jgi:bifunctional non-homologous end joining protein LigD